MSLSSTVELVGTKAAISAAKKRWQSALVAIRCTLAFLSPFTLNKTKKKKSITQRSPSFTVVNLNPHQPSTIDQKTLTEIVKEKCIEGLRGHGGVKGVAAALAIDLEYGISGDDAEEIARRREEFGSNTYHKAPFKGLSHFLLEAFKEFTVLISLACAALSLGVGMNEHGLKGGWYDGGSNILAAFIVISAASISNFRLHRRLEELSDESHDIKPFVVRSGKYQRISLFEIVVGDVVWLTTGDKVPADGLFMDGDRLQVDESSITGEGEYVQVSEENHPFLTSGAKVVDGDSRMLVTSVGMNTKWGQMMSSISREEQQTPLQARLNKLTSFMMKVVLAVAFLALVVLLIRYFTGNTKDENGVKQFNGSKTKSDHVISAVLGIVADAVNIVIPEGLPLAVTLILVYSVNKMIADHAMVRRLAACETMGSATTLCVDRTSTLTLNQIQVTEFWLGLKKVLKDGYSSVDPDVVQLIQEGVALNIARGAFNNEFPGTAVERALLSWAVLELNLELGNLKRSCSILRVETANSEKKLRGVLLRRNGDNTVNAHWKGAAEVVLKLCSRYYDVTGIVKDLNKNSRETFQHNIRAMANNGHCCVAFAHVKVAEEELEDMGDNTRIKDNGLTLLGLVGIKDPCRPGVVEAVEACLHAGINVKMITDENDFILKAIATECGILQPEQDTGGAVVKGEEFHNYTPEERLEKVDKIRVMARATPRHKLELVECLRKKSHVVAVIGYGINDVPALREADIGLSMGTYGTDVAKENSDIVILDDNFASVVTVMKWGRSVYSNIQKFIQFQLTVFVAALTINLVAAASRGEMPLTGVKLLWVNLIMDTLGAFALATEKPTNTTELMDKPPVGRTKPLITNIMWRNLLFQALFQIAVSLTLQFKGQYIFGVTSEVNDTLIFNTFVLCQVFNEFNARELEKRNVFKGIHRSKLFLGIICLTIVLQVVMVELLKKFAYTERLDWGQWAVCIGLAAISWPIGWIVKMIPVPCKPLLDF